MGSQESKSEHSAVEEVEESKAVPWVENIPSTPILTPLDPSDPRSPSANIARTPLETILGAKNNQDLSNCLQAEDTQKILGIDPRSPTVEFVRTPIIISAVAKDKTKLHNKNLDNVRKTLLNVTPVKSSNNVPPKLLESSPIVLNPTSNANKRKSFVGLLETNIDFTETDLDSVVAAKQVLNKTLPVDISETCITPLTNKLQSQMQALNIAPQSLIEDFENSSELSTENIDKTPIIEIAEPTHGSVEKLPPVASEDLAPVDSTINITAHVKSLDKKLTHLIYEDNSEDENKEVLKLTKIKENSRAPLGVRNSNGDGNKKSINRLKVSDKPRKSDISKIPIFKEYSGKRIGVQCENTPPRKVEEKKTLKPKRSQWDADKTLVI